MKSPIDMSEEELRSRFDFSKPTRGRFYERYQKGHTVTYLDHDPDEEVQLISGSEPTKAESTRKAGTRIFISEIQAAGLELAEPLRDQSIDFLIYLDAKQAGELISCGVQLKTSAYESFSLDKKDSRSLHSLIAYVWNAHTPGDSSVYALTFHDALRILENKGYAETEAWKKDGYYFVKKVDAKLKEMLEPYRMTKERWQQRLRTA